MFARSLSLSWGWGGGGALTFARSLQWGGGRDTLAVVNA